MLIHRLMTTRLGLTITLLLGDVAALMASKFSSDHLTPFMQRQAGWASLYTPTGETALSHLHLFALLSVMLLVLFADRGLYARRIPWWSQVKFILKATIFLLFVHGFLSFALKLYISRLAIILSWSFTFIFVLLARRLIFAAMNNRAQTSVALIAGPMTAMDLAYAFANDSATGYVITHWIVPENTTPADIIDWPRQAPRPHMESRPIIDLQNLPQAHPGHFFILAANALPADDSRRITTAWSAQGVPYAVIADVTHTPTSRMEPQYFFGHDILILQAQIGHVGISKYSAPRILKRMVDVAGAAMGLVILSPFFLGVALIMKIQSPRYPVFYGGERLGRGGKSFRCWKFRTMDPGAMHRLNDLLREDAQARAQWETHRKLDRDPRVTTWLAAWLRATSLDELPQLWNVLRGDMSLVGPRPALADEMHYYGDAWADYTAVQPGMTGLWQVSGRNDASFARRVVWDRWYVRNWSLWGDVVILLKTPAILILRRGVR